MVETQFATNTAAATATATATATGATSKDVPSSPDASTQLSEELNKTANHVYITSKDHGWIPAQVIERPTMTSAVVSIPQYINEQDIVCDGGRKARSWRQQTINDLSQYSNQALPLQNVNAEGSLIIVEDMVDLPFLHEAAILYNLKARHVRQLPYTRTGDIVIAVNPYQWFTDLYSVSQRLYYGQALVWNPMSFSSPRNTTTTTTTTTTNQSNAGTVAEDPRVHLPPHVYEASCLAYKGLLKEYQHQSILVSGESGAGKTETVKILLGDLASVQKGPSAMSSPSSSPTTTTTTTMNMNSHHHHQDNVIVRKVLDSNPLLEAFGNAQTIRNDNSSRFGKYLQLQFDRQSESSCILAGSKCEVYLLEKSRVTMHDMEHERTYHIFYQLLAAPDDIKRTIWDGLIDTDNESFDYVGYTPTTTIEGLSDAERFQLTVQALELIGVTGETLQMLWRTICIVLQLGNLDFEPNPNNPDASTIQDMNELIILANLMGIPQSQLITALTIRTVQARSETFQVPLTSDKAKESTDAFAKEIYAKTFLWLVRTINDATSAEKNYGLQQQHGVQQQRSMTTKSGGGGTSPTTTTTSNSTSGFSLADSIRARSGMTVTTNTNVNTNTSTPAASSPRRTEDFGVIGLLDIFGFETFDINRFEQLCINYANEKLQQKFTQDIFRSVQLEYEMEGIALEEITYHDNTNVLDLVEGKMGLLAFLNEECVRPQGSDKTFVYKAHTMNKDNACFVRPKHAPDHQFAIMHYAGLVQYDATNFVLKNMDTLPSDLQDCASFSTNDIVSKELGNEDMMNPMTFGSGNGGTRKKRRPNATAAAAATANNNPKAFQKKRSSNLVAETVWTKFKNQLTSLMETLGETKTRYIRCIKPNAHKKPLILEHNSTIEQLRCAGVVAAVTISRSAFPNRLEHVIVLERFKSLWPKGVHLSILQDMSLEPTERTSKATDALLTIALKDMEMEREDNNTNNDNNNNNNGEGGKIRAFVMGRTRAYFRAGALEFLEGERLRHLGTYAALIQAQMRGFCQRSKYQRFYTALIVLEAGFRRYRFRKAYRAIRTSAIRIQCWYRVLFASRTIIHLRRQLKATKIQTRYRIRRDQHLYRKWRGAAVIIQGILRGVLYRKRYQQALLDKQEEAKMENQLVSLQRKLEEAEARREQAEKDAESKARAALEEQIKQKEEHELKAKELESSRREEEEKAELQNEEGEGHAQEEEEKRLAKEEADKAAELEREIQMQEEQQRLMDESGRMLEYLRKEVFKLRSQNQQLKTDFDLLKDNNQRLMDANASAGASFAALNQHAKQMSKQNTQLVKEVESTKSQVQKLNIVQVELKDELKMKQASYVAEAQSRLQYQKALQKVTDIVQERCRDHRLVEKVLQVADECEMDHMQQVDGGDPRSIAPTATRDSGNDDEEDADEHDDGDDATDFQGQQSRSSIFGYLNFFSA